MVGCLCYNCAGFSDVPGGGVVLPAGRIFYSRYGVVLVRFSRLYAPTIKETPSDADVISYELLIRGGFIRKVASGVFTYLPLGQRVLHKISRIVREEMDRAGCQELLMPIAQPSEMWKQSGRWQDYGPEMMKLKDRHQREFTLGPTHEEMITMTVRNELTSYRDLPVNLYQVNTKYRDEIRPRFGLLRAREFIMKDAYSFHTTMDDLHQTYEDMYRAYERILKRLGLQFMVVDADTGAIGGSRSNEFVVLAGSGESRLLYCEKCGYSASEEKAEYRINYEYPMESPLDLERVDTPGVRTIDQVSEFLSVPASKIVKSLLYKGRDGYKLVMIRGDFELNLSKLRASLGDQTLEMASPENVLQDFGVPIGFIGPVGLEGKKVEKVADHSIRGLSNFVVGGMQPDTHYTNCNPDRDFSVDRWIDVKMVQVSDPCPECGTPLVETRGIEMGHIFELGTKYSEKLEAFYTDEDGSKKPFVMGCYGWGVSRTLAATVEQLHDENGMLWPVSIAPFELLITVVNARDDKQVQAGEELYRFFLEKGVEVLLDDREASPGFKFKDGDLIGIPVRITVGKALSDGQVEIKKRTDRKSTRVSMEQGYEGIFQAFQQALEGYDPHAV